MNKLHKDNNGYICGFNGYTIDDIVTFLGDRKESYNMMVFCDNDYYHLPFHIYQSILNNWYEDENGETQYFTLDYKLEKMEDHLRYMIECFDDSYKAQLELLKTLTK